jgi:AcrR family transcriptional regulator
VLNSAPEKKRTSLPAAKRPRGRPNTMEASRGAILDAAATLFCRNGYETTSLRDVAARSKLKAGSLYHYFSSKEEMLDAVMQEGLRRLHGEVESAVVALPESATHLERIQTAMGAHLKALHGQKDYIRANLVLYGHAPRAIKTANLALRRAYARYWSGLLKSAVDAGALRSDLDLTLVRLFVLGSFNWSVDWLDPKLKPTSELASTAAKLFLEGLLPQNRSR